MSISGPGPVQGGFPVRHAQAPPPSAKPVASPSITPKDELQISSVGRMLDELQLSGVRGERLATIKAAIEAGEYETPQKLEAALNRLLAEIRAETGTNTGSR